MKRLLVAVLLASSVTACGLPLEEPMAEVSNTCADDSECPDGACAAVEGVRRCVAVEADLAGIIFQVEGTATDGSIVSHVFEQGLSIQGARSDGVIIEFNLDAPAPLHLTGSFLHAEEVNRDTCSTTSVASDSSVPVKVEMRSSSPLSGLQQVFTAQSVLETTDEATGATSHRYDVPVPKGTYDVYITPLPLAEGCPDTLPPRIFPGVKVEQNIELAAEAEAPRRLTGSILRGEGTSLDGYRVELVEPDRGLVVSESPPLKPPPLLDDPVPLHGGADGLDDRGIAYYFTEGLVLRLSDAEGRLIVHWSFVELDIDGDGEVEIDLGDLIANPRSFSATVLDHNQQPLPGASAVIKSVSLTGGTSKNANFRVTAESDADGLIDVALVPGKYQVVITPGAEGGAAVFEGEWQIEDDSLCCGKSFALSARPLLTGTVSTGLGTTVPGVPVVASPSLPGVRSYFSTALESLEVVPRQAAGTTSDSGIFDTFADPGAYDISIRPASATGFPWLVLPAVVVAPVDQQPAAQLGSLVLPSPAVIVGRATTQIGRAAFPVPGAVVRAYLPLPDGEGSAPSRVVAIGEAVVGDDGRFALPVPPTVTLGLPGPEAGTTSSTTGQGL